ncbi:Protein kinase-like domain superfamily [Arabidopsis thaliana x Arabidopsis arenosa]|uniref:Protein kinase-like domain superfamily n=1 Tax=Arabidopsis thaliana x Arabidopsis arenosa TaxID=1240361 RepID=A0A8T1YCU0_9BRAS|nr:Protein kinase-like domain superfamily [Arabidopsis thaliana x Arabidopsis arenosa]
MRVPMFLVLITISALVISFAEANDPSPLQDFCVAIGDLKNGAKAEDFFFPGLNKAGNTTNRVKSNVTTVNVDQIPGLNTLGISLVRIDYAPYGQNPPHTHPRATEILVLVEGTLYVGFVSSNQDNNRLFAKVLNPGDVFVFPIGMIHFQVNIGKTPAVAFAGLNSQNAGVITIADTVFGSTPPINPDILAQAFMLNKIKRCLSPNLMDGIPCPQECFSSGANCLFHAGYCCTYESRTLTCGYTTGDILRESMIFFVCNVVHQYFICCRNNPQHSLHTDNNWKRKANALRKQNLGALVTSRRYSYGEIKKITKSFTEVVGHGGFGTVYKAKLRDGRKVVVKVLKDSKGNCEDFINEVASMSQTSHVNIVTLLGFCYEGSKRAIVYEFVEKGSLDQSLNLDVSTLYGIALGVARGIEYLHYGCKKRIVHFDIKPQNVLLDENLRPKVADFGLAKLCENQESILSLLDTRGTIGYIAPELFSRVYGNVSHKSDVYSYGMLVLEMTGARSKDRVQNADSNNSSAYFPDWIYKDLENLDNAMLLGDGLTQEEKDIAKKMILVGLWCIQFCPSDRPSMNKVVEMMEGSLDSLNPPPKPLLHMPMQNIAESSQPSEEESSIYSEV